MIFSDSFFKRSFLVAVILIAFANNVFSQIEWVSSTDQNRWVTHAPITVRQLPVDLPCDAEVLINSKQQKIDGWGGCFNELGWDVLNLLDSGKRGEVLRSLFDPNDGLKYTVCRMPIGANDYAKSWYSLDDTPGDFVLKNFNISRDQKNLIPYIKAAMRYQPKLQIWGSPWSPPAWMKVNGNYACQSASTNDLAPSQEGKGKANMFNQQEKYLSAYATYLSKYIEAYRKENINVYAIAVQNEPYACSSYPTCLWSANALGNFIGNYVGPILKKNNIKAEIWLGTINNNDISVFDTALNNANAFKYISAIGVQWAGKNAIAAINQKYPTIKKVQTETECGNATFDWNAAEYTFGLMKHYFNNGVSMYMYWNMVLDETGKSTWGWTQNAQIVVNRQTKEVIYTPEFFLFKHFSFFIPGGSVKLQAEGSFDNLLAFRRPDGKVVIVTANPKSDNTTVSIKIGRQYFQADLAAHSFNSFVL